MLMIDAVYPHFIRMAELEPSSAEWISELGEAARAAADGADELVQPAALRREVVRREHPGLARVLRHDLVLGRDHQAELLEGGRAVEMTLAVLVDDELPQVEHATLGALGPDHVEGPRRPELLGRRDVLQLQLDDRVPVLIQVDLRLRIRCRLQRRALKRDLRRRTSDGEDETERDKGDLIQ